MKNLTRAIFAFTSVMLLSVSNGEARTFKDIYSNEFGYVGFIECNGNQCQTIIHTQNSGHECNFRGLYDANGYSGKFYYLDEENDYLKFSFSSDARVLTVDVDERFIESAGQFCGMKAFYTGEYVRQ